MVVYRTIQMLGGTVPVKQDENAPAPPLARMFDTPEGASARSSAPMDDVNDLVAAQAYSAANWLALNCRRHMELYGTTKEQLGWLALNGRRNAALNPLAVYRDPMTMADYLGARPVSTPFGLLDCDVPIDGSIAVVVSHADYAARLPAPRGEGRGDRRVRRCRRLVPPRRLPEDGDVGCGGADVVADGV